MWQKAPEYKHSRCCIPTVSWLTHRDHLCIICPSVCLFVCLAPFNVFTCLKQCNLTYVYFRSLLVPKKMNESWCCFNCIILCCGIPTAKLNTILYNEYRRTAVVGYNTDFWCKYNARKKAFLSSTTGWVSSWISYYNFDFFSCLS